MLNIFKNANNKKYQETSSYFFNDKKNGFLNYFFRSSKNRKSYRLKTKTYILGRQIYSRTNINNNKILKLELYIKLRSMMSRKNLF